MLIFCTYPEDTPYTLPQSEEEYVPFVSKTTVIETI
jgi:hypothetical protein